MKMPLFMYKCLKRRLPETQSQLELWIQDVFKAGGFEDTLEHRMHLNNALMHLPNTQHKISVQYFVNSLIRSRAQGAAFAAQADVKEALVKRDQEERAAAEAKAKEESEDGYTPIAPI